MAPSSRHSSNLGQIIEYIPGTCELCVRRSGPLNRCYIFLSFFWVLLLAPLSENSMFMIHPHPMFTAPQRSCPSQYVHL